MCYSHLSGVYGIVHFCLFGTVVHTGIITTYFLVQLIPLTAHFQRPLSRMALRFDDKLSSYKNDIAAKLYHAILYSPALNQFLSMLIRVCTLFDFMFFITSSITDKNPERPWEEIIDNTLKFHQFIQITLIFCPSVTSRDQSFTPPPQKKMRIMYRSKRLSEQVTLA